MFGQPSQQTRWQVQYFELSAADQRSHVLYSSLLHQSDTMCSIHSCLLCSDVRLLPTLNIMNPPNRVLAPACRRWRV